MSVEIRIATEVLAARERQLRQLQVDFGTAQQRSFNAGPVDVAYAGVTDKWKEHRNELISGLDKIAGILQAMREAFEAVDNQLALGLDAAGKPPRY